MSLANALFCLGQLGRQRRNYLEARRYYEESLSIYRRIGHKRGIATTLGGLGVIATELEDHSSAISFIEESLAIKRKMGHRGSSGPHRTWGGEGIGASLENLALLSRLEGRTREARSLCDESLVIRRETDDRYGVASTLVELGNIARTCGELVDAKHFLRESLILHRELASSQGTMKSLMAFAMLATIQSETERAVRLFAACERLRESKALDFARHEEVEFDRYLQQNRTVLDPPTFEVLWAQSGTVSLEDAIEEALEW